MIKALVIIFFLVLYSVSWSQSKTEIVVSFSSTPSVHLDGGNNNIGFNFGVGAKINTSIGSIYVVGDYQVSGSIHGFSRLSNLLGGKFRFIFNNRKKAKFFIGLTILTEISNNYKFGFMLPISDDYPISKEEQLSYYQEYQFVKDEYLDYYVSTPFVGHLFFGSIFVLNPNLNLSLALGVGRRITRVKYGVWFPYITNEDIGGYPLQIKKRLMLAFQLGLSYTIPFQRHSKTE